MALKLHRKLSIGAHGHDVAAAKRAVYRYLDDGKKWKGYLKQTKVSREFFGPFFARDLMLVQKSLKLPADGIFGERTLNALERAQAFDWIAVRLWNQQAPAKCQPIPSGIEYRIIGYPNQGTHRASDWQSRNALDWGAPGGTRVLAPITGEVYRVGGSNGIRYVGNKIIFGMKMTIIPPTGPRCFLTHLADLRVSERQLIQAGDVVGVIGSHGAGSHLHCALEDPADVRDMLRWPRIEDPYKLV